MGSVITETVYISKCFKLLQSKYRLVMRCYVYVACRRQPASIFLVSNLQNLPSSGTVLSKDSVHYRSHAAGAVGARVSSTLMSASRRCPRTMRSIAARISREGRWQKTLHLARPLVHQIGAFVQRHLSSRLSDLNNRPIGPDKWPTSPFPAC